MQYVTDHADGRSTQRKRRARPVNDLSFTSPSACARQVRHGIRAARNPWRVWGSAQTEAWKQVSASTPPPARLSKPPPGEEPRRVESSADDGRKGSSVISGDTCVGNDTSHDGQGDFSARIEPCPSCIPLSKKAKGLFRQAKPGGSAARLCLHRDHSIFKISRLRRLMMRFSRREI